MSQQVPVPPVFGFSNREDSVNLEDIFSDWFTDDFPSLSSLAQPPPQPIAATLPQQSQQQAQVAGNFQPGTQVVYQQGAYPVMMPAQYNVTQVMQPAVAGTVVHPQQRVAAPMMMAAQGRPPAMQQVPTQATQPMTTMLPVQSTTQASVAAPQKNTARFTLDDGDDSDDTDGDDEGGTNKKKRPRTSRKMTEEQKVERRERNREHAKRSRVRKKFLLESLQKSVNALQEENDKLRSAIKSHLGNDQADELLKDCAVEPTDSLITQDPSSATKILEDPDYTLVKALQTAQQNFVITDPSLPDNPIVYASQGFLNLTGYSMEQILGRNCRFLQGPETDPEAVDKIRKAIEEGVDGSVCLVNYREDGTTFWNQFFIAALRGADGSIVNYVGVQCKVSEEYAKEVLRAEKEKKDEGVGKRGAPALPPSSASVSSIATAGLAPAPSN